MAPIGSPKQRCDDPAHEAELRASTSNTDEWGKWIVGRAAAGLDALSDRVATMRAGKHMLDEGGAPAELLILAKKVACEAVQADVEVVERIQGVIDLYAEANNVLRKAGSRHEGLDTFADEYQKRAALYTKLGSELGAAPAEPPMSREELDASKLVGVRLTKARLGLRHEVGEEPYRSKNQCPLDACMDVSRSLRSSESAGAADGGRAGTSASTSASTDLGLRASIKVASSHVVPQGMAGVVPLEQRLQELFRLHDLNGNGVLEEWEFVELSERVAARHHGRGLGDEVVQHRYREIFRQNLNAQGQPVGFSKFREYMMQALSGVDSEEQAQVALAEQLIAEAHLAVPSNKTGQRRHSASRSTSCAGSMTSLQSGFDAATRAAGSIMMSSTSPVFPEIEYPGLDPQIYPSSPANASHSQEACEASDSADRPSFDARDEDPGGVGGPRSAMWHGPGLHLATHDAAQQA